jgi:LacI family transcriptional regulator
MEITVRIKDVANKAGVSTSTVSRVLNGGKFVREEIKERVNEAIKELRYTPSYFARSLVLQKTNLIGVIVSDIASSFFSTILSSIEDYASKHDYNILVGNISEDLNKEVKYLNIFNEMRVDGIILMHDRVNESIKEFLNKTNIPLVQASSKINGFNFPSVNINDYKAAYDATNYLIKLGHRNIALIGGNMGDISAGLNRYQGYKQALEDNMILVKESYIKYGNYKVQDGYRLMEELLSADIRPTAVFASSDDMAIGAMNCIIDNGLKVPEDISIIGFDDSNLASVVRPSLTTVHQPIREIGELSIEILIKKINNQEININEIVLNHKLIIRDSCKGI